MSAHPSAQSTPDRGYRSNAQGYPSKELPLAAPEIFPGAFKNHLDLRTAHFSTESAVQRFHRRLHPSHYAIAVVA
jgi:hypothetical protein